MADQALLNIVIIEEPTAVQAAGGAGGGGPWSYRPGHTPEEAKRFADLSDAFKRHMAGEVKMSRQEQVEFFRLEQKLPDSAPAFSNYANFYANAVSPAAPASAAFRQPSAAPPGWNVPGSRQPSPAAASVQPPAVTFTAPSPAPPGWAVPGSAPPPTGPSPLPPFGIYQPPSPAPPGWGSPPSGPPGGGSPPPSPADPGGFGPGFPGWDNLYRSATAGRGMAGTSAAATATAGTAALAERIAADKAAKKRRGGRAWRRQFEAWRASEDANRTAFDTATAHFGRGRRAMLGAAVGGYRAAAAGGSVLGGAASGAMAAVGGGPIGLALAAKEVINATADSAAGGLKALGESAQKIAGNDHLGLFKDAVTGAGKVMDAVSPVTGAAFKVAAAGAVAFAETANAFAARGRELAGYNGALASATATADVRSLRADIREANAVGPDVARLIDAQSRADVSFRVLIEPAKQAIAKFLAGGFEKIADRLETLVMVLERTEETRQAVGSWIQRNDGKIDLALGTMGSPLLTLTKRLIQHLSAQEDKPTPPSDELIQRWLNAADGMGAESYIPAGAPVTGPGFGQPGGPGGLELPVFAR